MLTTDAIQSEIERLTQQIEEWEKKRAELDEVINPAKRERDSWQYIHARRTAENPVTTAKTQAEAAATSTAEPTQGYGARSRVMREHILASVELGVTPKSIQEYMRTCDLPVSANFVYKTLAKMRDDGEIENRGGVYRPVAREVGAA